MTSGEKMSKGFSLFGEGLSELITDMAETLREAINSMSPTINSILEEQFTKKKFMKMLQSYGKQRNEIKKIMIQEKAPYTREKLMNYVTYKDIRKKIMNK